MQLRAQSRKYLLDAGDDALDGAHPVTLLDLELKQRQQPAPTAPDAVQRPLEQALTDPALVATEDEYGGIS